MAKGELVRDLYRRYVSDTTRGEFTRAVETLRSEAARPPASKLKLPDAAGHTCLTIPPAETFNSFSPTNEVDGASSRAAANSSSFKALVGHDHPSDI